MEFKSEPERNFEAFRPLARHILSSLRDRKKTDVRSAPPASRTREAGAVCENGSRLEGRQREGARVGIVIAMADFSALRPLTSSSKKTVFKQERPSISEPLPQRLDVATGGTRRFAAMV
jgi:hypothetical protein